MRLRYAAKLLKKHDQSRMVTLCSHLFWVGKQVRPKAFRVALPCRMKSCIFVEVDNGHFLPRMNLSALLWPCRLGKGGSRQHRDARRVLECLQRAVQIADDMCMAASTHVDLFIEILNHYLYHFESENEVRTSVALTSPPVECTLTFAWLFVPPIFCF